jgi:HSP20 family protein
MFDTMLNRDVRQTLDAFRQEVDRFFSSVYGFSPEGTSTGPGYAFTPAIESSWTENDLTLRVILPGVTEEDVKVSAQNGQLVIEGERKAPEGWGENSWTKLPYGKFYAGIAVPDRFDLEKVSCRLHDGILDIQVPVAEHSKPRQIPIESGETQKAIPASA